jgi:phosphate:Na+ symporter
MGANVGTTVTAWILSLGGIDSDVLWVQLLKPTSFTPLLALIGIIYFMFGKNSKKKDTGMILLGFATLMFGMDTMSGAVSGLRDVPAFQELFITFTNPILGVLAGAILTAIIQSSSASVGILQTLSSTGQVSFGAAIPIIMGQNIGTCVTAVLSSMGATKNAKRTAVVHLSFNVIGTIICLSVFCILKELIYIPLLEEAASYHGIAIAHSAFNIICTLVLFPMSNLLEKLARRLVPDAKAPEHQSELDERLLATPAVALERSRALAVTMATVAVRGLGNSITALSDYTPALAESIREDEDLTDHYEDILGTYVVKLSSHQMSEQESAMAAELLRMIGDFERISDHSVNLLESAEELREKEIELSESAAAELRVITDATREVLTLSLAAFVKNDIGAAASVEALEQIIDHLKESLRSRHILRLQQGNCTINAGFIWSDLLTNLERVSDHCSNIAGCVLDIADRNMHLHKSLRAVRRDSTEYNEQYERYVKKYELAPMNE